MRPAHIHGAFRARLSHCRHALETSPGLPAAPIAAAGRRRRGCPRFNETAAGATGCGAPSRAGADGKPLAQSASLRGLAGRRAGHLEQRAWPWLPSRQSTRGGFGCTRIWALNRGRIWPRPSWPCSATAYCWSRRKPEPYRRGSDRLGLPLREDFREVPLLADHVVAARTLVQFDHEAVLVDAQH
jgi:hypothetical protein